MYSQHTNTKYYEYPEVTHLCINPGPVLRIPWYAARHLGDTPKFRSNFTGKRVFSTFLASSFFSHEICALNSKNSWSYEHLKIYQKRILFDTKRYDTQGFRIRASYLSSGSKYPYPKSGFGNSPLQKHFRGKGTTTFTKHTFRVRVLLPLPNILLG